MTAALLTKAEPQRWKIPARGVALFEGERQTARLSHYFMPALIQHVKKCGFKPFSM